MENTNKVNRTILWEKIHEIVKKIPRKEVNHDALDAPSATTEIEQLFINLNAEHLLSAYKDGFKAATESLISANNMLQTKKIS